MYIYMYINKSISYVQVRKIYLILQKCVSFNLPKPKAHFL